ncbi:hypothetical protein EP47_09420 [Legionella norrlandica]|uniref:Spore coat protein n=1 Tax=Legionella norrlandica TaxID=1498499 RepID=A0A0A2SRR5_9GAMM|nr:hypothetical protein [Legionella norrlandica]KGP63422.1 hypothetical protein EP47_09420 [Legionella norrlandica]
MKYLISLVFFIPLLSSCTVIQEDFYQPGYLESAPRVEVNRYYPQGYYNRQHYRSNNRYYYAAPRGKVYHNHPDARGNAVIVNPSHPQSSIEIRPNVHEHTANDSSVHRHPFSNSSGSVHGHPNSNVHGHDDVQGTITQNEQAYGSRPEEQKRIHGHS